MRVTSALAVALLSAAEFVAATPSFPQLEVRKASKPSKRPSHKIAPKHPGKPFPVSPTRTKVCTVASSGNGTDDSPAILSAIDECNNGGHVVFSAGTTYTIGTALDLTFLNAIDLGMSSFVSFCLGL